MKGTGHFSYLYLVTELSALLSMFCWLIAATEVRKHRFEINPLCSSDASYGSELSSHNDIGEIMTCALLCMDNIQCESCLHNESSRTCSLNSVIRVDKPACQQNVKYAQKRELQCVTSGLTYKVCSLDLHAVPGEITGYIEVNVTGVWGTVCDDFWEEEEHGYQNANVFCKTFGYSGGSPVFPLRVAPIIYHGPIVLDTVKCLGSEASLLDCPHHDWTNCNHDEDTRVRCY